jgi:hypothetical protein
MSNSFRYGCIKITIKKVRTFYDRKKKLLFFADYIWTKDVLFKGFFGREPPTSCPEFEAQPVGD